MEDSKILVSYAGSVDAAWDLNSTWKQMFNGLQNHTDLYVKRQKMYFANKVQK